MINETSSVAVDCCIYDGLLINTEHVAAHSFGLVFFLPLVAKDRADDLTGVFHHHFTTLLDLKKIQINFGKQNLRKQNLPRCLSCKTILGHEFGNERHRQIV